jgi:hypothetical protein
MYKHLFDMACTEAERASYHTCGQAFIIFFDAFLCNRKVGTSKAVA